jgi:hypothetical protein
MVSHTQPWHRHLGDGAGGGAMPAALEAAAGELVAAFLAIEQYGVEGWMRLHPDVAEHGADPELMEHLAVFRGELARLEHEEECRREAARRAEAEARRSRGR